MNTKTYIKCHWDRALGLMGLGAGIISVAAGYVGVSGTRDTAEQLPYVVSGGIVGLMLFLGGLMFWLSADMRDEWRKLDRIEEHLQEGSVNRAAVAARPAPGPSPDGVPPADLRVAPVPIP